MYINFYHPSTNNFPKSGLLNKQLDYLTESNSKENGTEAMCRLQQASPLDQCDSSEQGVSSFVGYYAMFILGQMFHGIGAVPMFTIALTYIDENCKQKMTSFYVCMYDIVICRHSRYIPCNLHISPLVTEVSYYVFRYYILKFLIWKDELC